MTRVAILGTGNVGQSLAEGLVRAKHGVRFGSRDPSKARVPKGARVGRLREAAEWGEVVILAVPFHAVKETILEAGTDSLTEKVLVDATNALTPAYELATGSTTSGAEELAKLVPRARVVKAFNTVFAGNMATGRIGKDPLTLFVAGDDAAAKGAVIALGRDIGFEPVDAGLLRSARYLEPMGMQLIALGYGLKMGTGIGFRLIGPKKA